MNTDSEPVGSRLALNASDAPGAAAGGVLGPGPPASTYMALVVIVQIQ